MNISAVKSFLFPAAAFLVLISFSACKKDNQDEWSFCYNCGLDVWEGYYMGTGDFFVAADGESYPAEVQLTIVNTSEDLVEIDIVAPDYYDESFFGRKDDDNYYFTLEGTTKSIQLNLYEKSGAYRITGVSQKYHYEYDPVTDTLEKHVDKSLTFEVNKTNE